MLCFLPCRFISFPLVFYRENFQVSRKVERPKQNTPVCLSGRFNNSHLALMCVFYTHTHTTSLAEAFESIYRPHDTSFHVSASKNKDPPHVNRVLHLSIVRKLRILKYNQLACYMYHFPYLILHKISTVLASGWLKITFPFASLSPSLKATTINKILSICSEKYCMYIFAYIHFFK